MERMDAIQWVLSVTIGLRLSQSKTLADLVAAAMRVERISLANIGRALARTTTAKHAIKRVWRFTSNPRIEIADAMSGVIERLFRRRKKLLVVALDWTDIRGFHTLVASAVLKGRSIPLVWASYQKWQLFRSQNSLEEGLLRLLKSMLPKNVRVVLLADRGFGRTEMARFCRQNGLHYVIRVASKVWIETKGYRGKLADYPVKKGMRRVLKDVRYRRNDPVTHHVLVRWVMNLPKHRDEPWFLFTDLPENAVRLTDLYAQRMTIEELFRDAKSRRNGSALRNIQIKSPDRVDRLLLIIVLAYLLLCGIGLRAKQKFGPCWWSSNNRPNECSLFTIGKAMIDKICLDAERLVKLIRQATLEATPNWG